MAAKDTQLKRALIAACEGDLSDPFRRAHALKTLALRIQELDPDARPATRVLFAIAEILHERDIGELTRPQRPRSIVAWADTRREKRYGLAVERYLVVVQKNITTWLERPGMFLSSAWSAGILDDKEYEAAAARLRRLLRGSERDGRALEAEDIARAVLGRARAAAALSFLDKRTSRKGARRK